MSEKSSGGGLGLGSVLLVIFVVLKFVGAITWSWWWVLSPIWIGLGLWTMGAVIILIITVITYLINGKEN